MPGFVGLAIEPFIGVLGDTRRRRLLVLGGGVAFALGTAGTAASPTFWLLLAAQIVSFPASGAFVSLSQATLMDLDPARRERGMALWTLAGSAGVVAGPLLLAGAVVTGAGWRALFGGLSVLCVVVLFLSRKVPFGDEQRPADVRASFRAALAAVRRRDVLRWLALLEVTDLMLDVLHGFLALYLVDVAGASPARAALGVAVWTGAGLAGDALLLLVLRRFSGLSYLRASAAAVAVVYPALLLTPGFVPKLVPLALLGLLNSGWYAIPKARLYEALPGQSGSAMALGTITGFAGGAFPLAIGLVAGAAGLGTALWIPLAAPLILLVALPRR